MNTRPVGSEIGRMILSTIVRQWRKEDAGIRGDGGLDPLEIWLDASIFGNPGVPDAAVRADYERRTLRDALQSHEVLAEASPLGGDGLVEVAEERKREVLALSELGRDEGIVDRDAENLGPEFAPRGPVISNSAELLGADPTEGQGIKNGGSCGGSRGHPPTCCEISIGKSWNPEVVDTHQPAARSQSVSAHTPFPRGQSFIRRLKLPAAGKSQAKIL